MSQQKEDSALHNSHLDIQIDPDNPEEGITTVFRHLCRDIHNQEPVSYEEDLTIKELSGGLINRMYLVTRKNLPTGGVLVRIHQSVLPGIFDRDQEFRYMQFLETQGYFGKIYGRFLNGICYQYMPGRPLTVGDVKDPDISRQIAQRIAEIHAASLKLQRDEHFAFGDSTRRWFDIICAPDFKCVDPVVERRIKQAFPNLESVKQEFEKVLAECKAVLSSQLPLVLCHNDLVPSNIIYDEFGSIAKIHIIDYEFAEIGYQAQDIGYHMSEFVGMDMDLSRYPSEEFQLNWIHQYLNAWKKSINELPESVTDDEIWNTYVRASKMTQLRYFACVAVVVANESRNANYLATIDSVNGHDAVWYALENLRCYELRKKEIHNLELRPG